MSLVRVAVPESESQLALMLCALEAAGIPHFVHNAGLGSLLPGMQIAAYNSRGIMVPESCADQAAEIIADLGLPEPIQASMPSARDKWRMVFEALCMAWFVPGRRARHNEAVPPDT